MAIQFSFGEWVGRGGGWRESLGWPIFFFFQAGGGSLHSRSLGLVMDHDGPVLPPAAGMRLQHGVMTEPYSANTSLDRSVSAGKMGRELVDMWTAAASLADAS